jgi:4-amino-4-deoxy-L-arabinose transferase-like glycosyltransferase
LQPSTLAKRGSILLFVAFILFYFYGLGHLPFIGPDEPRYAQVAREMLLRSDWITPTLGGYLWFEKPALLYWLVIAAFKVVGTSEWAARSAAAVSGLLTVAAVFWMGKRVEQTAAIPDLRSPISNKSDRKSEISDFTAESSSKAYMPLAFWCAFVAGTSGGLIAFSRAVSFDILVTMTIAWALAFFFAAELELDLKSQRRLLAGFYFALGVSLLAKGLVGFVVSFGVIGAYYTLRGRAPARKILTSIVWGVPLTLAVAATWYGPMFWKHGILFFDEFIIKHHFQRYATNKYHHPGAIYYYLEILPLLALPWTALLIDGVLQAHKAFWRGRDDPISRLQNFALAWLVLPLIFFSLSSSKLPGYILPALPAAALLTGLRLAQPDANARRSWAITVTGALGWLIAVALHIFAGLSGKVSVRTALLIAIIAGIAGALALWLKQNRQAAAFVIGVATCAVVIVSLHAVAPRLVESESTRQLIQQADQRGYARVRVFGLQRDDRTPEFYAADRVVYGEDHEPVMYDGIGQVIYETHQRKETLLVLIPMRDLGILRQDESVQIDEIANNGRVAIVAVTPL